jgi:uncharacterized membrane protein YeiH
LVILGENGVAPVAAALLSAATVILVRLLAIHYDWSLPKP